jgi:hypothetical protein
MEERRLLGLVLLECLGPLKVQLATGLSLNPAQLHQCQAVNRGTFVTLMTYCYKNKRKKTVYV